MTDKKQELIKLVVERLYGVNYYAIEAIIDLLDVEVVGDDSEILPNDRCLVKIECDIRGDQEIIINWHENKDVWFGDFIRISERNGKPVINVDKVKEKMK